MFNSTQYMAVQAIPSARFLDLPEEHLRSSTLRSPSFSLVFTLGLPTLVRSATNRRSTEPNAHTPALPVLQRGSETCVYVPYSLSVLFVPPMTPSAGVTSTSTSIPTPTFASTVICASP